MALMKKDMLSKLRAKAPAPKAPAGEEADPMLDDSDLGMEEDSPESPALEGPAKELEGLDDAMLLEELKRRGYDVPEPMDALPAEGDEMPAEEEALI